MTFASKSKCYSIVSILLVAATMSCSKGSGDHDKSRLATLQLDAAPNIPTKLDIAFGDQVTLLGYKLDSQGPLHPKDKVKVTFYWRLDKKVEPGFRLTSRVVGERGEVLLNADDIGKLRERRNRKQILAPSDWQVGKVYVDDQLLRMPSKLPGRFAKIIVGLRKAETSLIPKSGDVDKRGYLTIATLPIEIRNKATTVPQVNVPLLESNSAIKIDGKLDEEAWKIAASVPVLADLSSGREPAADAPLIGKAKLLWNDQSLFVALEVQDKDLEGGFKKNAKEPLLWKRDAVEFVFKLNDKPDNKDYYRIATGLQNLVFDSFYEDFAVPNLPDRGPVGDLVWSSKIKYAVQVSGTVDDAEDDDVGYVEEIQFPWSAFDRSKDFVARAGASVWINFAVWSEGDAIGYSPYLSDKSLQVARRFGKIVLSPVGTPNTAATQVPGVTTELPASLAAAQTAALAALAAGTPAAATKPAADGAQPAKEDAEEKSKKQAE
jgi:hypothetical protein